MCGVMKMSRAKVSTYRESDSFFVSEMGGQGTRQTGTLDPERTAVV